MSRGFVKEDDQEEAPFIPPRAALPHGAINYVTPFGYKQLVNERKELEAALSAVEIADEKENRHTRAVITGKLSQVTERISTARILPPENQPKDEVRFGAVVSFKDIHGDQKEPLKKFQLVGVDEADIKQHKIAFVAPLAAALTGRKKGDIIHFKRGPQVQELEIISIEYDLTGISQQ